MSSTGRFSTVHVPDDGTWYTPGDIVRLDESSHELRVISDPLGTHAVHSCRRATEYTRVAPLLRVGLRKLAVPTPAS